VRRIGFGLRGVARTQAGALKFGLKGPWLNCSDGVEKKAKPQLLSNRLVNKDTQ